MIRVFPVNLPFSSDQCNRRPKPLYLHPVFSDFSLTKGDPSLFTCRNGHHRADTLAQMSHHQLRDVQPSNKAFISFQIYITVLLHVYYCSFMPFKNTYSRLGVVKSRYVVCVFSLEEIHSTFAVKTAGKSSLIPGINLTSSNQSELNWHFLLERHLFICR